MQLIISIAAGGALGAVLRHLVNHMAGQYLGLSFPYGILIANVLGSFLMGVLIAWFAHISDPSQNLKAFLTIGFLGAFTTFSSFSLDTITLVERGAYMAAGLYVVLSVTLALMALLAGMALIRQIVL